MLVPHDPRWRHHFEVVAAELLRVGNPSWVIEHIGSTAIPGLAAKPRCEFWPDSLSYVETDMDHARGHRRVIESYLAGLAAAGGSKLATLDEGLVEELPASTVLVPPA